MGAHPPTRTPTTLTLEKIGAHDGGVLEAAEITAFDPPSNRLFVVNGANGTVDVLDFAQPRKAGSDRHDLRRRFRRRREQCRCARQPVALAIEAAPKTDPGVVALYEINGLAAPTTSPFRIEAQGSAQTSHAHAPTLSSP